MKYRYFFLLFCTIISFSQLQSMEDRQSLESLKHTYLEQVLRHNILTTRYNKITKNLIKIVNDKDVRNEGWKYKKKRPLFFNFAEAKRTDLAQKNNDLACVTFQLKLYLAIMKKAK